MLVFDGHREPGVKRDAISLVFDGEVITDPSLLQPDGSEIDSCHFVPVDKPEEVTTQSMATRIRAAIVTRGQYQVAETID